MFVKNIEISLHQGIDWSTVMAIFRKHTKLELLGADEYKGSHNLELFCSACMQCASLDDVNFVVTPPGMVTRSGKVNVFITIRQSKNGKVLVDVIHETGTLKPCPCGCIERKNDKGHQASSLLPLLPRSRLTRGFIDQNATLIPRERYSWYPNGL
jgi:hypothetical protein